MTLEPKTEAQWHWEQGTQYVLEGGRSLLLLNGVAAAGLLTFLGTNHPHSFQIFRAIAMFAFGSAAAVALFVAGYVAQLYYGNRSFGDAKAARWARFWHRVSYAATVASIGLFCFGIYTAQNGLARQFLGPKAEVKTEQTGKVEIDCNH
jgi:hypothetical protein